MFLLCWPLAVIWGFACRFISTYMVQNVLLLHVTTTLLLWLNQLLLEQTKCSCWNKTKKTQHGQFMLYCIIYPVFLFVCYFHSFLHSSLILEVRTSQTLIKETFFFNWKKSNNFLTFCLWSEIKEVIFPYSCIYSFEF